MKHLTALDSICLFTVFILSHTAIISQDIDCDGDLLTLDNSSITTDTIAASDTLKAASTITSGSVLFQSPISICLEEEFQVADAAEFQAQIADCTEIVDCGTCTSDQSLDPSRGDCNETLSISNSVSIVATSTERMITANSIPSHMVGLFGGGPGSLNPNTITAQSESYTIELNPSEAASFTALLSTTGNGPDVGPQYSFGVLLNGVELDPEAAEPFPHEGIMSANVNWEWNLEALNVNLGLDCNSAHVQPTGKYHYHGSPTLYLENANITSDAMTHIGWAADGFPIYYKYAYTSAEDNNSAIIAMTSSYQLRSGCRGGDGVTVPCDEYNGVYSNDYEYIDGLGTLDKANGRTGVTPDFPSGTYYYVITDKFPSIPRYFRGTPSNDFSIGM